MVSREKVINKVRAFIRALPVDKLITSRMLVHLGSRTSVDNSVSTLVAELEIVRVSRGIFRKPARLRPVGVNEVAQVKANSFGRKISMHAQDIARKLGLKAPREKKQKGKKVVKTKNGNRESEYFFACDGRSSRFRFEGKVIHFKGVSLRKMALGDSPVGKAIRVLTYLGRQGLKNLNSLRVVLRFLGKTGRLELLRRADYLPSWISDLLHRGSGKHAAQEEGGVTTCTILYEPESERQDSTVQEAGAVYLLHSARKKITADTSGPPAYEQIEEESKLRLAG